MRGTRGEAVADREVPRRGHGPGDLVQTSRAGLDGKDCAQQTAGVLVGRVGEQFLSGSLLNDLTGVHDGDVVGNLCDKSQVVGDEDHCESQLLTQLVEQVDDLLLNGDVQCGGRFISNDELRVAGQCHCDQNSLTLATGEFVRVGLQGALGVQAHQLEEFLCAAGSAALGQLLHLCLDEHGRVQRGKRILVDHCHLVAQKRATLFRLHLQQVLAFVEDLTGDLCLRVNEAHDGQRGNGLTTSGLTDEAHGLTGANLEGNVVDDIDIAVTLELDAQVLDLEQRCFFRSGNETIVTLAFDNFQIVQALLQGLGLLGVCTARIQKDTVGFAVRVLIDLSNGCRGGSRDHSIGDAFGEDVQAQDGDHDEQAGEEGGPPVAQQDREVGRSLGQDIAPSGNHGWRKA